MESKTAFLTVFGTSKNFMTPTVMSYGQIGRGLHYELSKGTGLEGQLIVGVTIVEVLSPGQVMRRDDLAKMFYSVAEAKSYIEDLKKGKVKSDG